MKKASRVVVKNNVDNPVAQEVLAEAIATVARGAKVLLGGSLNERAILLLIQDAAGGRGKISLEDVKLVLRSAAQLEALYVTPKKTKR